MHPDGSTDRRRLLTIKQVLTKVPVSRQTIYNWEKAGLFPKRIAIGGRAFWLLSEIDPWIDDQAAKRSIAKPEAAE